MDAVSRSTNRELERLGRIAADHGHVVTTLVDALRNLKASVEENAAWVTCGCCHHRTGGLQDDECGDDPFSGHTQAVVALAKARRLIERKEVTA